MNEIEKGKFTIGLPIYNEEKSIGKVLDAIIKNIEYVDYVIISDNNSTDLTPVICKEYCDKYNKIIYYKNEKNIGAWNNMVKVLKLVSTEFYMQLGGHDHLAPNSIKLLRQEIQEDVVCCFGKAVIETGERIDERYVRYKSDLASEKPDERFVSYLLTGGCNLAYYGIARTEIMRKAVLCYENYMGIGADNLVVAYMSLYGKLIYIPEAEITILVRQQESNKERYKRYRQYGMNVPYINPGKPMYKYVMQIVDKEEALISKKNDIKSILKGYDAYESDLIWLRERIINKVLNKMYGIYAHMRGERENEKL